MSVNPDVQRIQNAMLSTDLNVRALSQSLNQVTSQISTINDLMIKQRDLATDEFQQIQQRKSQNIGVKRLLRWTTSPK